MAKNIREFLTGDRYSGLLLVILLLYGCGLLALRLVLATSSLPETGGVSINVLYGIVRVINGGPLYTDPEQPPFAIIQYMPLHFQVIRFLSYVLGINGDTGGIMILNRMFCLATDLLTAFLLGRQLRRKFGLSLIPAIILPTLYFCCIPAIIFGRADNLYLLFFLLSIIQIIRTDNDSEGREAILLAGLFTALALATKQTGIFLAFFILFYLIFIRRAWKDVLAYSIMSVLTFASLIAMMKSGEWHDMKLNIVDGIRNGINPNWFAEVILKNFFLKFSYLIALGFLTGIILLQRRGQNRDVFLGMGIFYYFFVAGITSFKAGSGPNYFLEFILLTLLGTGWLIAHHRYQVRPFIPMAFVLVPFFIIATANDKGWGDLPNLKKTRLDGNNAQRVAGYIKHKLGQDEWVLTTFHKQSTINLRLSDKTLFPTREVALGFCKPMGVFHFDAFKSQLEQGKIRYVIDKKGYFPDRFMDIPLEGFKADTVIGNYAVYELK